MKNFYEFKGYRVRITYDMASKAFVYQRFVAPDLEPAEHSSREPAAAETDAVQKRDTVFPEARAVQPGSDLTAAKTSAKDKQAPEVLHPKSYHHLLDLIYLP
jgi:hypothetical protein